MEPGSNERKEPSEGSKGHLYSFAGWYIGMQNSRFPMYIAITQNIVNIAVSLLLVYGLGMKIEGVAIGTLTAQYAGLVMAYCCGYATTAPCGNA